MDSIELRDLKVKVLTFKDQINQLLATETPSKIEAWKVFLEIRTALFAKKKWSNECEVLLLNFFCLHYVPFFLRFTWKLTTLTTAIDFFYQRETLELRILLMKFLVVQTMCSNSKRVAALVDLKKKWNNLKSVESFRPTQDYYCGLTSLYEALVNDSSDDRILDQRKLLEIKKDRHWFLKNLDEAKWNESDRSFFEVYEKELSVARELLKERHEAKETEKQELEVQFSNLNEMSTQEKFYLGALLLAAEESDSLNKMGPTSRYNKSVLDQLEVSGLIKRVTTDEKNLIEVAYEFLTHEAKKQWILSPKVTRDHSTLLLWKEIALAECEAYLQYRKRELKLHALIEPQETFSMKQMLQTFSIAQMFRIIWKGVKDALSYGIERNLSLREASESVLMHMERYIENSKRYNFVVPNGFRPYSLPESCATTLLFKGYLKLDGFLLPIDSDSFKLHLVEPLAELGRLEKQEEER